MISHIEMPGLAAEDDGTHLTLQLAAPDCECDAPPSLAGQESSSPIRVNAFRGRADLLGWSEQTLVGRWAHPASGEKGVEDG